MKRILFILSIVCMFPLAITTAADAPMRVHFIDVGQGDSILIETPQKKNILIDGGEPEAGKQLIAYLKEKDIEEIDLLIATHPDFDHIGGLNEVLAELPVKEIIDNGQPHLTRTYATYRLHIIKQLIPVNIAKENQDIALEKNIDIQVLNAAGKTKNNNESSIVLKVSYNDIDFLLMSDVEAEQEKKIAKKYDVETEVLKIAHHGSNSSSSMEFLKKAKPEAAIISYSKENNYGHPVERVIENLEKLNTQIYSTAVYGNIVIETDGENYIILPDMNPMEKIIQEND